MLRNFLTLSKNIIKNGSIVRGVVGGSRVGGAGRLTYWFAAGMNDGGGSGGKIKSEGAKVDQKFKKQSKQFYQNHVQKIIQLKSSQEFQTLIASITDPIVLDLYADWCEPCKKLTPKLEAKVNSLPNVKMIKVNIDKCPEIAHALQVKSVPTVYLLYQGQAIDKFQGNVGEKEFEKFFQTLGKIAGVSGESKQAIEMLETARQAMGEKKFEQAITALQNIKQKRVPTDILAIKQLLLTQCYLTLQKPSKSRQSLSRASQHEQFYNKAPDLHQFYTILKDQISKQDHQARQDPELKSLTDRVGSEVDVGRKLDAKYDLFAYYKGKEMNQSALEIAMEIIREDKGWKDKKVNKEVLEMFKSLGNASPLVQKYRKIMQRLLS